MTATILLEKIGPWLRGAYDIKLIDKKIKRGDLFPHIALAIISEEYPGHFIVDTSAYIVIYNLLVQIFKEEEKK